VTFPVPIDHPVGIGTSKIEAASAAKLGPVGIAELDPANILRIEGAGIMRINMAGVGETDAIDAEGVRIGRIGGLDAEKIGIVDASDIDEVGWYAGLLPGPIH
jgi:hypothetical protein